MTLKAYLYICRKITCNDAAMKRIAYSIIAFTMLMIASPAKAQFDWGIKGGVNIGNNDLTILKDKETAFNIDNYAGFFVGPKAEVSIPVVGIGFEIAAMYAQKNMTLSSESFNQNSFLLPLSLKYSFGLGKVANIFIAVGPEFGFNVGETSVVVNNLKVDAATNVTSGDIAAYIAEKSTLSFNLGLGATLLKHVQVGFNYNMPWRKTGELIYIEAAEIENVETIKDGENITIDNIKTLSGTVDKVQNIYSKITSGSIQVSVAYLF